MPNRIIREGILTSEPVNALSWEEEVFYRRLLSVVDDYGRYSAHTPILRASLYPLKLDAVRESNIERLLAACEKARLVRLYLGNDGKRYMEVTKFGQQMRAKSSKYPDPPCVADAKHVPADAHSGGDVAGVGDEGGVPPPPPREDGSREIPDWPSVKAYAFSIGLPEWKARDCFDEMESCGWIDSQSRPIRKWRSAVNKWKSWWENDGMPATRQKNNGRSNKNSTGSSRNAGTCNDGLSGQYAGIGQ